VHAVTYGRHTCRLKRDFSSDFLRCGVTYAVPVYAALDFTTCVWTDIPYNTKGIVYQKNDTRV
jgi:hypothetical protein